MTKYPSANTTTVIATHNPGFDGQGRPADLVGVGAVVEPAPTNVAAVAGEA
jgi:hypothetical protein